jgi:tetratricopeptide (TPR) repeat protein
MVSGEDLSRIREAVRKDALNAELRYLLGAELAHHGEYEQAAIELTTAIQLDPSLHIARLQLGLLYLTLARPAEATATWAPLDQLPDGSYPKLFKQGLEHLIRDEFTACIARLEQGIAANTANAPLNHDMALIIGKCRAALAQQSASPVQTSQTQEAASTVRTDFSLYDGPTTRQ